MKTMMILIALLSRAAIAHETIFPHTHPHPLFSLLEDFLLTGLWFAIWASIAYGSTRLYQSVVSKRVQK